MKKIINPILPKDFKTLVNSPKMLSQASKQEMQIRDVLFENINVENEDFSHIGLNTVKFVNCRFWNSNFEGAEFTDVIFQSCDFSGCNMDNTYFNRIEFQSCKGVGTKFTNSIFKNIVMNKCNLKYANFAASKLEYFKIVESSLNNSFLTQCKFKAVLWKQVDLTNASFFRTSLQGMDFTESIIAGITLSEDLSELKGAVVDIFQAVEISKRIGIIIKDIE